MNVNLKLIILHLNLDTMINGCLLDDEQIISISLQQNDIKNELKNILVDFIELKPDWVRYNLVDIIPEDDGIAIVYTCMIPALMKNKKGQWTEIGRINDTDTKKLVFQASQKISPVGY
jgi:hypothetical protein